jgi:hypothetical protein
MKTQPFFFGAALLLSSTFTYADSVEIIGAMAGVGTGVQTIQQVQNGGLAPLSGLGVLAGGVNAYLGNQPYGQAALGAVSIMKTMSNEGGAIDPAYDAIDRFGSIVNPNNANIASAALSTIQNVGLYGRPQSDSLIPVPPVLHHPALESRY